MSAIISPCGLYRYRLERAGLGAYIRGQAGVLAVIMVNPSTADAEDDDPTIRKLLGFTVRAGFASLIVGNLFAYRATDVRVLGTVVDPVGPDNDDHLIQILAEADQVVCAWGPLNKQPWLWRSRYKDVLGLIHGAGLDPYRIGPAALCGQPKHPLMLPYNLQFERHI